MSMTRFRIVLTGLATAALLVTASAGVASAARYMPADSEYGPVFEYERPDTNTVMEIDVHSTGEPGGPTEDECHEFDVEIAELKDMQNRFYDDGAFGDAVSVGVQVNATADAAEDAGCFVIY